MRKSGLYRHARCHTIIWVSGRTVINVCHNSGALTQDVFTEQLTAMFYIMLLFHAGKIVALTVKSGCVLKDAQRAVPGFEVGVLGGI